MRPASKHQSTSPVKHSIPLSTGRLSQDLVFRRYENLEWDSALYEHHAGTSAGDLRRVNSEKDNVTENGPYHCIRFKSNSWSSSAPSYLTLSVEHGFKLGKG